MATIYTADGATLTEGLQGSNMCDEAIIAARSLAEHRGEYVVLEDDDGIWTVHPDGSAEEGAEGFPSFEQMQRDREDEREAEKDRCRRARQRALGIDPDEDDDLPADYGQL